VLNSGSLLGPGTVAVTGTATLGAGGTAAFLGASGQAGTGAHLLIEGSATVASGGLVEFYEGSELENQGTVTLKDSATLQDDDGNSANKLLNDSGGTVTFAGSRSRRARARPRWSAVRR
jgi:hypothetical protein